MAKVAVVISTDGKREYTISVERNYPSVVGQWQCACIGWTRHVPRRDCKHIKACKLEADGKKSKLKIEWTAQGRRDHVSSRVIAGDLRAIAEQFQAAEIQRSKERRQRLTDLYNQTPEKAAANEKEAKKNADARQKELKEALAAARKRERLAKKRQKEAASRAAKLAEDARQQRAAKEHEQLERMRREAERLAERRVEEAKRAAEREAQRKIDEEKQKKLDMERELKEMEENHSSRQRFGLLELD